MNRVVLGLMLIMGLSEKLKVGCRLDCEVSILGPQAAPTVSQHDELAVAAVQDPPIYTPFPENALNPPPPPLLLAWAAGWAYAWPPPPPPPAA